MSVIINLISAVLILAIGILIFSKNTKNNINRTFLLFSLSIFFWAISLAIFILNPAHVIVFKLSFVFASLLAVGLFLFSNYFPDDRKFNYFSNTFIFFIFLGWVIISFISLSPLIVPNVSVSETKGIVGDPGSGYLIYMLFLLTLFSWSIINIYLKYRKLSGEKKLQIRYFFLGVIIFVIFGVTTNLILPQLGIYKFNLLGPSFSLIVVALTAYSILAHHLFDIRVIIKKTVIYSVLLLFVLATYVVIVTTSLALFGVESEISFRTILPNLFAAILIAVGFDPLKEWLSDTTDKWLYKGEYKTQDVLSKLSDSLSTVIDLNEALVSMMKTITESMRIGHAATFVLRKSVAGQEIKAPGSPVNDGGLEVSRVREIGYDIDEKHMADTVHPIIHYFEKDRTRKILITEDIDADKDKPDFKNTDLLVHLKELKIALAMPITTKDRIIGLFILGEKLSGDFFSQKDMDLLEIAVKQTAAAIEKARFYEEDQLKSEFVSIASHELLTPTSAIEGYLSMILDEHLAKVDKKAENYLTKVYASSRRLAALVKDLLNVSRIEGGRIVIQWHAFDIVSVVNSVLDELKNKSDEKKLKVNFVDSKKKIIVFADEERVQQIVINLIGNAIKYTEKGGITINVNVKDKSIMSTSGEAEIAVTDSGIGMSEEDQAHLFEKFYRASNAGKYGAGGTGLGLYISKNLAELMGGKIRTESVLEKGTTFFLSLKIASPEQIKNFSEKPVGAGVIPYKRAEN